MPAEIKSDIKSIFKTIICGLMPVLGLFFPRCNQSERVADGEVECKAVLERRHVVIAVAASLVRSMDATAPGYRQGSPAPPFNNGGV